MPDARCSLVSALLCSTFCSGACIEQPPKEVEEPPAPPDMSALVAVYDSPNGTFDTDAAAAVLDSARSRADQIARLGIDALLLGLVQDAVDALSEAGNAARGEGYLDAERTCAGWQQQPEPAEGHGRIELTVGFREQRVDAVAWGQAIACEYLADGRRVLLYGSSGSVAGDVRLSFGESVAFEQIATRAVLLDLDATAEVDGRPEPADLDFRIDSATSLLELRMAVDDGDVIALAYDGTINGVRAANGVFAF
jgi:hypothetical protein